MERTTAERDMAKFERYLGGEVDLLRGDLDLRKEKGFKIPLKFLVYILGSFRGNIERVLGLRKKCESDFTHIEFKVPLRYSSGFIK